MKYTQPAAGLHGFGSNSSLKNASESLNSLRISLIVVSVLVSLTFIPALVCGIVPESTGLSSGVDTPAESDMAQVSVTNISLDPAVFSSYDTGILSVELTNTGTENVPVTYATVYDNDIKLKSNSYDTTIWIGAKDRRVFTFTINAACAEGKYYPVFSVSSRNAGMRLPVYLQVDNTPLTLSILDKPDTFTQGKKETLHVQVSNPRRNLVREARIVITGDGIESVPADLFLGSIEGGGMREPVFAITPNQETNLTFTLQYSNGDNQHESELVVPVTFNPDKKQADPDLSNLIVKKENGLYHVTGDVTNAGLTTAYSVVVTSGGKAAPVYPYKTSVVGALKPDDFSSFDLTFTANETSSVPVIVTFRDQDGNRYDRPFELDLTLEDPLKAKEKSGGFPVTEAAILLIALGAGGYWYYQRRYRVRGKQ
ncbi:MAG TPA: hypothetical protein VN372_08350 [Methanospirillum sp.]|nr:hypothetical protein [Methanospirillum sp.]